MKNKFYMQFSKTITWILFIFTILASISLLLSIIGVYGYYLFYNKTLTIIGFIISLLILAILLFPPFAIFDTISFDEDGFLVKHFNKITHYKWENVKNIKIINNNVNIYFENPRPISFLVTKALKECVLNTCKLDEIKEKFLQIKI